MAINHSIEYKSASDLRRALKSRLKQREGQTRRSFNQLRREFLYQSFLALVSLNQTVPGFSKGGGSLLARLKEARFSDDLDLLHTGELSEREMLTQLNEVSAGHQDDQIQFVVDPAFKRSPVNPVVKVSVKAYIGGFYDQFTIDISRELHIVALPEITVYPIVDQISDKVSAMYALHYADHSPSTRYRDILDRALIISSCAFEADCLHKA